MARIACFIDTTSIRTSIEREQQHGGHEWQFFAASALDWAVRAEVQQFAPDVMLLEVTPDTLMTQLFIFLWVDAAVAHAPIVLIPTDEAGNHHCFMADANGCLPYPFSADEFWDLIVQFVPQERVVGW